MPPFPAGAHSFAALALTHRQFPRWLVPAQWLGIVPEVEPSLMPGTESMTSLCDASAALVAPLAQDAHQKTMPQALVAVASDAQSDSVAAEALSRVLT